MSSKFAEILKKELKLPLKTIVLDETDSTNNYCKTLSRETKEDTVVISLLQNSGKGRMGRSFFSPKDSGIYLSILLHPYLKAEESTKITTAAAVAAAEAIDEISGKRSSVKWVNDIYLDNKKVCGILTETGFSGKKDTADWMVMGIGVNLFDPIGGFPSDIKDKAGSVFGKLLPSPEITVNFIKEFVNRFLKIYAILPDNLYMENYKSRSMLTGKNVSFIKDGQEYHGFVLGIDNDAGLLLATDKGAVTLRAGEVSLG